MKKIITTLLFLSIFLQAQAKDFSYCASFFKEFNENASLGSTPFPFEINSSTGKLIDSKNPSISVQNVNGARIYMWSDFANTYQSIVQLNGDESIKEVEMKFMPKSRNMHVTDTVFMASNSQGKCFPMISTRTVSENGANRSLTGFDSKLCRDIENFFQRNSETKRCFNQDSRENKEMMRLFENNGYTLDKVKSNFSPYQAITSRFNQPFVEEALYQLHDYAILPAAPPATHAGQRQAHMDEVAKRTKVREKGNLRDMVGSSPLVSANMILSRCKNLGLEDVYKDDSLWTAFEAKRESSSGESK